MANIADIKKLRDATGAGMVDCQNALAETNGDFEAAVELLRKKGVEKAGKKADRETNEGLIATAPADGGVAFVALACETDFVARNDDFIAAVTSFAEKLAADGEEVFKDWAEETIKNELIVKIGENIQLADFALISGPVVGQYVHSNGKVASAVVLSGGDQQLADDIAMQVVAMKPQYLTPADVPAEVLDKEREVYREQMANENKPAEVMDKIVEGKLNKFYSEACLIKQSFIKDEDKTIEQLLADAGVEIQSFRYLTV